MPFEVSQWPYKPDPRKPDFNLVGWNFGQVPPWKWVISTTAATGIYSAFNAGVIYQATPPLLPQDQLFTPIVGLGNDLIGTLSIKGTIEPQGSPSHTISIGIGFDVLGLPVYGGGVLLTYPTAIQVHSGFAMAVDFPSDGTIPNDMKITPAIWSAE